jgi:glycerol uptake facilitator-like aquaporin
MCVAYGRQFSGGVYNPAVTLFRMLRKIDRVSIKMGLIYMLVQFLGACVGSLIGKSALSQRWRCRTLGTRR